VCHVHYPGHNHDKGRFLNHRLKQNSRRSIWLGFIFFFGVKLLHMSNPVFSFKNTPRVFDVLLEG
jgi:hypothetical protein